MFQSMSSILCSCLTRAFFQMERFSFNAGGLEVGVVFARCFHDRNRRQGVRSEGAKPHRWAARRKCAHDVLEVHLFANIACFCCLL